MVSTVRVLLLMVWELTISPVALYDPSSDSSATLRVSVATTGTCVVLCRPGSPRVEGSLYTMLSVCTIGCGPPLPGCMNVNNKMSHMHFYLCYLPSGSSESFVRVYTIMYMDSTEQSCTWEASQEVPCILWYPKVPYILFTRPTPYPYPKPH